LARPKLRCRQLRWRPADSARASYNAKTSAARYLLMAAFVEEPWLMYKPQYTWLGFIVAGARLNSGWRLRGR